MDTKPKTKIRDLTFKEKIDYIREYYKLHIIVALVIIFVVGAVVERILNPPPIPYVQFALMNMPMTTDTYYKLKNRLDENLQYDRGTNSLEMIEINMNTSDPSMNMALIQKFIGMVAAQEIDIILCDKDEFEALAQQTYFTDLTELFTDEELKAYEKYIVTALNMDDESLPLGISLAGNKLFEEFEVNVENHYAGIVVNTLRMDNAMTTIRYIMSRY